jgi:GNAT superfamily N-acetyltransferase
MLTIRSADSDADLEAWRAVRIAVLPGERTATVAELREQARPGRHLVVAELDGVLVGSGVADRSDVRGASIVARVLPEHRRRGIGTALLHDLAERALAAGHTLASAGVDSDGDLAFAQRFGFVEVDRQVEQVRAIGDEPRPRLPDGVRVVTVVERPDLWDVAYHTVAVEALADMAVVAPLRVSRDEWNQEWINAPEATFLALAGDATGPDEVVALASLMLDPDRPERAEQGFTACRRDWRGRGVAAALKRMTLWWAAGHAITEVYTWTQQGNDDMRRVNEHLGFRYGLVSIRVEAPLPLPALATR